MPNEPTKPTSKTESKGKPKLQFSLTQLLVMLQKFKPLLKHHYFAILFLLLCGLAYAVYEVNNTLGMPSDETYRQQKVLESLQAKFDETTIGKIEALQKSTDNGSSSAAPKPGARTNPFTE